MREPLGRADTDGDPQDRAMKLASLRDQIARDQYAVDPNVVAEAFICRICSERASGSPVSRRDARSRAARARRRPR
jgi:hypothetical protein